MGIHYTSHAHFYGGNILYLGTIMLKAGPVENYRFLQGVRHARPECGPGKEHVQDVR